MRSPRSILFIAMTLVLGAQSVWAVEGDIVFERKDRPAAAPSMDETATGDADAQPAGEVEERPLEEGAEQPAAADSQTPERKPGEDIISESESIFYAPATFPHWTHIIRYRCFVCHPRIYAMEVGSSPLFGIEHHKEKSCGRCHNGRNAFDASFKACGRCHISQEEQ